MKLRFSSALFASLLAATTITFAQNAQTPTPQQPDNPATSSQAPAGRGQDSAAAADHVTLTGCLQQAPEQSDASTSANAAPGAATAAPTQRFMLVHAMTAEEAAGKTTTASGAPEGKTYALVANAAALAPHVGKKVELTGTVEGQAPAERFRVESGKALPTSCQ